MYELLRSIGYEIPDRYKLIGEVRSDEMTDAIDTFFTDPAIKRKDLLLFYFSGHGVPEASGENFLASSEVSKSAPWRKGFSYDDLTKMLLRSRSESKVIILDCCYSGAAKLGKGSEEDSVTKGIAAINSRIKTGYGKYVLAACQGEQEAFDRVEGDYSQFTYYLIEGLKENKKSVNKDGSVTPETLSNYIVDKLQSLEPGKRPKQDPIRKVEGAGDIVLAYYPDTVKIKQKLDERQMLLKLLQQGKITEFNKKHEEDPDRSRDLHEVNLAKADLRGADLREVNLAKADLRGANLVKVNLREANLRRADLREANLSGANLEEANLIGANVSGASLENASLWRAYLWGANLEGAKLEDAGLIGANLREANLIGANLKRAGLSLANFEGANLKRSSLSGANLENAYLEKANLEGANLVAFLKGANLEGANLSGANLENAYLVKANLARADLERADLRKADLRGAKLNEANLSTAKLEGAKLEGAKLGQIKNLPISKEEARERGAII
jgi:uncharacterized protein YjbI with pentapeptide repeats